MNDLIELAELNTFYERQIIDESKLNLVPKLLLGLGIIMFFVYSDLFLRHNFYNFIARIVPIILIVILLVLRFVNKVSTLYYYHIYSVLLVSLIIMMYIICYKNLDKDYLASSVTGLILVHFILAYELRSNITRTSLVFFVPFITFLYYILVIGKITSNQLVLISNFFPMLLLGFLVNIINNKMRFSKFMVDYNLNQEKNKVDELLSVSHIQNEELITQNEKIQEQKEFLEIQQHEILDSIEYAQLIQNMYLPEYGLIKKMFSKHFIINKPKDIVSGDFYWAIGTSEFDYLAVIDCTGHGVPGAFLTFVATSILNKAIFEIKLTESNEILSFLNEEVYKTFQKRGNKALNVGMDIIICAFNKERTELKFSGAYHSLIHIRKGLAQLYRTDLIEVGLLRKEPPIFEQFSVSLVEDDLIYIYTDGYADQIGGEKERRFMTRRFKEILQEASKLEIYSQKQKLIEVFEEWRGDMFQTDDILVFGIQI
jgi:serine phosphatase RsbU (regulator of sigma subunit)